MKKKGPIIFNIFFRAVAGMCLIFLINAFLESQNIDLRVGYNIYTLLTSAILGLPGVGALYGIVFLHFL